MDNVLIIIIAIIIIVAAIIIIFNCLRKFKSDDKIVGNDDDIKGGEIKVKKNRWTWQSYERV